MRLKKHFQNTAKKIESKEITVRTRRILSASLLFCKNFIYLWTYQIYEVMDKLKIKQDIEKVLEEYKKTAELYVKGDKDSRYKLTKLMGKFITLHLELLD